MMNGLKAMAKKAQEAGYSPRKYMGMEMTHEGGVKMPPTNAKGGKTSYKSNGNLKGH